MYAGGSDDGGGGMGSIGDKYVSPPFIPIPLRSLPLGKDVGWLGRGWMGKLY